jgi:hypothetical protein
MRRPSKSLLGSPDVVVDWQPVQLLRAPGLLETLGDQTLKLKVHLQKRKIATYRGVVGAAQLESAPPLTLASSSNMVRILRISLQTATFSRTVASASVPLRTIELQARGNGNSEFTFSLVAEKDGQPLALVPCRLSLQANLTPAQQEELAQLELEAARRAARQALPPVGQLCASASDCFAGQRASAVGGPSSKRSVSIHPDFL